MIYRSSWSFVAPNRFFAKLRILHLVNFTDGTVFQTFFYTIADIVLIFWHISQLPAFLKAAFKDRHISCILKDDQIPSFTSKRILYLQEYMQPVGDLVLPCNTFRMLVLLAPLAEGQQAIVMLCPSCVCPSLSPSVCECVRKLFL